MGGWITRALAYRRDRQDLEGRLANAKADADYWRNEYGNKQAELVEAKEKAELERNLNEATIKDLQEQNQELVRQSNFYAQKEALLRAHLVDTEAFVRIHIQAIKDKVSEVD